MDQSKVKALMPSPEYVPNRELTVTFSGTIQQTQLNTLKAVNRYPGMKYQTNAPTQTIKKYRSRGM